ncbi:MAG: cysteine desulfurase [Phycisphaerales bacterium]|jgi:cysteine desulfurase/selenocysteine lyase|nr:cysteine desulfurase [Phycisphaerales bacterium]
MPAVSDITAIRSQFPALQQQVNGKPLAYLDNAATTQKPQRVIDAISRYYEHDNANIHRGVHALSLRATAAYENARSDIASFLGADRPEEIVFVRGATEAINLAAQAWGRPRLSEGDEILITELEHHSNIVPWQLLCEQSGASLKVAPIHDDGSLDIDAFRALLTDRTAIVAVAHVSNAIGTINPVAGICEMARKVGATTLIDGAQATGHLAVNVQEIGCDFYATSGHKMYGPTGIGCLYGRHALLDEMDPWQGGGDMILSVSFEQSTWNKVPFRFEAGTPNIAGVIGLGEAVAFMQDTGLDSVSAAEHDLLDYGTALLQSIDGVQLVGTAPHKAAILAFTVDGVHPHDVGTILDHAAVAIRTGHHCAEPLMRRFGVAATCRASMAAYNERSELDRLAEAVQDAIRMLA